MIADIVDIQLAGFTRLLKARGLKLELEKSQGVPGRGGLRPGLRRAATQEALREYVLEPLSEKIICGEIPHDSTVRVERLGDTLSIFAVKTEPAQAR